MPRGVPPDAVIVARAGRAHGVHGEMRFTPESEDVGRLLGLTRVWLASRDGEAREFEVESARPHQGVALVHLRGVDDPESAARLALSVVWASPEDLPALEGDAFGIRDVLGATIFDGDAVVGPVVGLSSGGGRDFFEVEVGGQRVLIPAIKDWLVDFDRPGRRIVMRLPAGLLDT